MSPTSSSGGLVSRAGAPDESSRDPVTVDGVREIGVGMLGYAFMGKAHSNAFRKIAYVTWPPPLTPRLVAIAGRDAAAVASAARRYGFERSTTQWEELIADPAIGLFDNLGPNDMHAAPTIAAAEAGKHVVCEKPLGRDADESYDIWRRVAATGVKHMCAFNYRFVPAVRLARELIDAGELGELRHFRGRYLQDWGDTSEKVWRFDRAAAGSGALGDLAAHVVDLARYLVGEIETVGGFVRTFIAGREVDDAVEATVEFRGGAVGTIEATRLALGRRNAFQWEINGSEGSLYFDMERLNELQVFHADGDRARGFKNVLVTESDHPFAEHWWPPGHIVGWGDTFVHELHHMLAVIAEDTEVTPHGATFEDGYRAAEVCDAIVRSSESGRREAVAYRITQDPGQVLEESG
ncbi:MAG: Gfo/Idh/MocA family oxidoreductase [Actinobacteria bacterium]|nr:MAG: Gfo/Idh/MocA family oxidoreductase [Actinomycetota bacterium]